MKQVTVTPAKAFLSMHWWIYLLSARDIVQYGPVIDNYIPSFILLSVPLLVSTSIAICLRNIPGIRRKWKSRRHLGKSVYIILWYSVSMLLMCGIEIVLSDKTGTDYFESCALGNPALLAIPSIVVYALMLLGIGMVLYVIQSVKSNKAL